MINQVHSAGAKTIKIYGIHGVLVLRINPIKKLNDQIKFG